MNVDFGEYFESEFKKPDMKLYHDWVYERIFGGDDLDPAIEKKIKTFIHEILISAFWVGDFIKIDYGRKLATLVKVQAGPYKGKRISGLPHNKEVFFYLMKLKKETQSDLIKSACNAKIGEMDYSAMIAKKTTLKQWKKKNY